MAKRKKTDTMAMPVLPTPKARRKWAADSMAHTLVETSPKMKKMHDAITSAVLAAGEKAIKKHG